MKFHEIMQSKHIINEQQQGINLDECLHLEMKLLQDHLIMSQGMRVPVMIEIDIKEDTTIHQRQPVDLIFVIDVSISMRGKKMQCLRKTINSLLTLLNETDRICLIAFNTHAQTLFPLNHLNEENKKNITSILNSILPMGQTNIAAGLLKALDSLQEDSQISIGGNVFSHSIFHSDAKSDTSNASVLSNPNNSESNETPQRQREVFETPQRQREVFETLQRQREVFETPQRQQEVFESPQRQREVFETPERQREVFETPERQRSIFLLSDGMDERCETKLDWLRKRVSEIDMEFTIHTFGYGEKHDAVVMNEIASFKGGNFYQIENIETCEQCFADALGGLFSVVGSHLEFSFQITDQLQDVQIVQVYGDMWRQGDSTKVRNFSFNQILSGISKQVMLEINIPIQKQCGDETQKNSHMNQNDLVLENQIPDQEISSRKVLIAEGRLTVRNLRGLPIEKCVRLELNMSNENDLQKIRIPDNQDVLVNFLRVQCAQSIKEAMDLALRRDFTLGQMVIQNALDRIANQESNVQRSLYVLQCDLKECLGTLKRKIKQDNIQNTMTLSSFTQFSYNSSESTQDCKVSEVDLTPDNIRRLFLYKTTAYMRQVSLNINLHYFQNPVQKSISEEMMTQTKLSTLKEQQILNSECLNERSNQTSPLLPKAKKILIPLKRTKFESMNVSHSAFNQIIL